MAGTPSDHEVRVLDDAPGSLPLMLKAAAPAIPGVSMLPGLKKTGSDLPEFTLARKGVAVDRGHVAAYAQVCAFPRKDAMPLPYLHMLAFPLHMAMLTDPAFPFPALGMVHVENTITQLRPITADEKLQVTARPANLRPHAKGRLFDLLTTVHSGGELVWEETSTFLRIGKGDREAAASELDDLEQPDSTGTSWKLPGDLGRRYAAVSGDHNPIHLYALTAKAFGFPRQIAHGMWTKARSIAAIENRLPAAVTVEVAFRKPVFLPGTVAYAARRDEIGWTFALTSPKDGSPHLLGRSR